MPSSIIGIYLHIPFCRTCCPYCDYVRQPWDGPIPQVFIRVLCQEITSFDGSRDARSIFFGGGTPSLLEVRQLGSILDALAATFHLQDPEITLEANPDDITVERVRTWKNLGINRISVGIQSFSDHSLEYLGRRHNADRGRRALDAVSGQLDNWNIDLIYGMPPLDAWERTVETALAFHPPHVSLYPLTYEPGTPFEKWQDQAISDDTSWSLYRRAEQLLAAYDHYEISNFAAAGRTCRHNLVYWTNEPYAGFGPGAYAYIEEQRMRNHPDYKRYLDHPGAKILCERVSKREQKIETLIQHFRLRQGIRESYYQERFASKLYDDFGDALRVLEARGLLVRRAGTVFPSERGFYLNNEIGLVLVDAVSHSKQTVTHPGAE